MADGVQVRNLNAIVREIDRLGKEMAGPAAEQGLKAGALEIRELARANLIDHIDTGALFDSLRVTSRIDAANGKVKANLHNSRRTYYGAFLEWGTVKMKGIHWMQRAAESGANGVIDDVRRVLEQTLNRIRPV